MATNTRIFFAEPINKQHNEIEVLSNFLKVNYKSRIIFKIL